MFPVNTVRAINIRYSRVMNKLAMVETLVFVLKRNKTPIIPKKLISDKIPIIVTLKYINVNE